MKANIMNLSYQERNHWISASMTVWALVYYFIQVFEMEGGLNADLEQVLPVILNVVVRVAIVAAVLTILNWSLSKDARRVEKDERDRLIELKGYRNGYWVSSGLLWIVIFQALLNELVERSGLDGYHIETINLLIHSIFVVAWVATLAQSATHLYFYRRGLV